MSEAVELGGRYRLDRLIGKGGMGEVYRGVDLRLGRPVAVKVLPRAADSDEEGVARFIREARLAATLQHPGITVVHDIDVDDNVLFLVMELLSGEDLGQLLERNPHGLSLDRALQFAIQICTALGAAHAQGIVHRDLKPSNLMVIDDDWVKILDFGLAKYVSSATGLTGSGVLGTPVYMAPEQFLGRDVDQRTDLYLFGGVLNELLCGQPPFPIDEGIQALIEGHLNLAPRGPQAFKPNLPDDVQRLVLELLAKSPHDRPRDAAEVTRRLKSIRDSAQAVYVSHPPPQAPSAQEVELEQTNRLAARYCHEGRFAEALPLADQAVRGRTQLLGPDHPDTLSSRQVLGSALYMLGRGHEAEPVVHGVAEARSRVLGQEDLKTLRSWQLLAKVLYVNGKPADACSIARGVAVTRYRLLGPEHAETLESRNTEGWALHVMNRNPEAWQVVYEVANARARVLGPTHVDTLDSRLLLARVQLALGRPADAYATGVDLHRDCMQILGPANPQTAEVQALLNACSVPPPPMWHAARPAYGYR